MQSNFFFLSLFLLWKKSTIHNNGRFNFKLVLRGAVQQALDPRGNGSKLRFLFFLYVLPTWRDSLQDQLSPQ